ncbi:ankyrin repeat domain-containing protein [Chitinophaga agri]|uniref:Ankyrin repeat domain-containing protein n=1 Tax=Chitinophaga agri TaxID=2703787 RepID=A0A6B9ZA79_9BACT|nr:ankyrin repeat domain-containing protein [Chitinophaga agri]QHS59220.1 ankyrin repeat domain-containing protein [Chitinophaga agri]
MLDEIGVNATNDLGETPLIVAAYLNRINVLKKIIGGVDNVDYKVAGTFTESALLEACAHRRLDSIKLLVDAGARLEQVDRFGLTPLAKIFTNIFSDPLPCATYLISKGAKITAKVMELGMSWNQEKMSRYLTKK